MPLNQILNILKNSGFHVRGVDMDTIYLEDPTCILRSFSDFLHYAWIAIYAITAILLFGWAVSMIRGVKNDLFINIRNLTIIFGVLTATGAAVKFIWGDDLFAVGCKEISISVSDIQKTLGDYKLKTIDSVQPGELSETNGGIPPELNGVDVQ